jgi:hypothetical protein
MTADNLSVESVDAKISYLFERFERQHREVCEIQQILVNLESNVRNESAAFREDVNDIFDRLSLLDKVKLESEPDIVSSWSDFMKTSP